MDIAVKNAKRKLIPEEEIEDYFLRLKEICGYSINITKAKTGDYMCWIQVLLKKDAKIDDAEKEFDLLVDELDTAKIRLIDRFGFECGFFIWFNSKPQFKLNPKTHKSDLFIFSGIGDKSQYNKLKEDEFYIRVEFMII